MLLRLVVGVRNRRGGAFRFPLLGSRWALRQLPFVFEQVLEKEVAPSRRRLRPGDLRTAGDCVGADSARMLALPAEALLLERAAFRLWSDQRRIARTKARAKAGAARDQCDARLVVDP